MEGQENASRQTRVIAIGNQKGGVGKTTNSVHIAAALGELGRKVLLWDLDEKAGSTVHLGIPKDAYDGTYHILSGQGVPSEIVLRSDDAGLKEEDGVTLPPNVDFIPAARDLEELDNTLRQKDRFFTPHALLLDPIGKLRGAYDYIILDTAPTTSASATLSAYMAADYFLLTVIPEKLAIEGLHDALKDVQAAQRNHLNPNLRLLGVLVSSLDKRINLARSIMKDVREAFVVAGGSSLMFNTVISRAAALPRACDQGTTIFETAPTHRVAKQYRELVQEVEERIRAAESSAQTAVAVAGAQ